MDSQKTEYDIADHINESRSRSCKPVLPGSLFGYVGHISGFSNTERMTSAPPRPSRLLRRLALLAVLVLCAGQSLAAAHLHLDEHEEEDCTLCAISDLGHVPDVECVDAQRPERWRSNDVTPSSAILSPRPYEVARSRAPPVSVS